MSSNIATTLTELAQKKIHEGRKHPLICPKPAGLSGFGSNCPNHRSGSFYCCHRQTGNGAAKHKKTSKTDFDIERPERPQSAQGARGPPQGGPWGPYQPPRHPHLSTRSTNHILLLCHRQTGCCLVLESIDVISVLVNIRKDQESGSGAPGRVGRDFGKRRKHCPPPEEKTRSAHFIAVHIYHHVGRHGRSQIKTRKTARLY